MILTLVLSLFSYIFGVALVYFLKRKKVIKINLNDFAKKITLKEGLKESISIAQVKEVTKLVLIELSEMTENEASTVIARYRK